MPKPDYNLERFVAAQAGTYETALAELERGQKETHWIWYVFPQLRELGRSERAKTYGLSGLAEAVAYCAHPVLGARLRECVAAMLRHPDRSAVEILGEVDALKFKSCLTLFSRAAPEDTIFTQALQRFFERLSGAASGDGMANPPPIRTSARRRRDSERAGKEIERMGG